MRMGTIFESSHIELHKWLQAIHLMCSSKKGISAHQLHRVLECSRKLNRPLKGLHPFDGRPVSRC